VTAPGTARGPAASGSAANGSGARGSSASGHSAVRGAARGLAANGAAASGPDGGERAVSPVAATYRARQMLARAHWAAGAFAGYDRASVLRIAEAVATAAHAQASRYAEWAVRETGFGVAEHKTIKNEACSLGVFERYRHEDFVSPRIDAEAKIVSLPRPAGVILALTPSTNPVCSVFFKVILALLTRNAIVISPHPMAKDCCGDAARLLAGTATRAGAPDGVIGVVEDVTVPLIEAMMADPVTSVIVATGGTAVVRAAHRSGNPALGVGPGNVPVLVDATADLAAAARLITESKAFDNSVLCTNESVLIIEDSVAGKLLREMQRQHAVLLDEPGRDKLRDYLFPAGRLNGEAIGKDAAWIAARAGLRVPPRTRVLLAPFDLVLPEEPFAHEKLCPVLGVVQAGSAAGGIEAARAVIRIGGAGHSAAIHSQDPQVILRFAERVPVLRVAVNAGNSKGSSGLDTNLAPSMTLGTGFAGHSSIGENLEPRHLVNWARVAYNSAPGVPFGDFTQITVGEPPSGPVPAYPLASNLPGAQPDGGYGTGAGWDSQPAASAGAGAMTLPGAPPGGEAVPGALREQLRALIIEELQQLIKG
jgi:acetaldehyde dehydrogenase/alcohol dehydrogenase